MQLVNEDATCGPDGTNISIIVPVYNVERYLDACLLSLRGQTCESLEIICIDDGSVDGSSAILKRHAEQDQRIRIISQSNAGVARSRNRGLDAARGEYVLFVDSDDYIRYDACEALLTRARETQADVVVFGGKTFPTMHWADASFAGRDIVYRDDSIQAVLYEQGARPLMCNKLYRRKLLEQHHVRFKEDLKLGEDHAFQFRVFPLCKTIAFMKDCLYFYRGRMDSAIGSRKDDHAEKVRLHFDVVRYVVDEWSSCGYLVGHEREMAEWACTFLYNDAPLADFNDRIEFSRRFDEFMAAHFSVATLGKIAGPVQNQYKLMSGAYQSVEKPPEFTVVIESLDGSADISSCFQALGRQTEQRIEFLIVVRKGQEAFERAARAFAEHDRRMKVLAGSSIVDAVKQANGRYTVCTSANVVYEDTLFEHLLTMVKDDTEQVIGGADVFTMKDADETLKVPDVFDVYEPDPFQDFSLVRTYSPDDLHGRLYEHASLSLANKVFATPLLQKCARESIAKDGVSLCAYALRHCEAVYPTNLPAATMRGLAFATDEDASSFAQRCSDDVRTALEEISCREVPTQEYALQSLRFAACQLIAFFLSSIHGRSQYRAAFDEFKALLNEMWPSAVSYAEGRWSAEDLAKLALLFASESDQSYERQMSDSIDRLSRLNRSNLLMVGDFAAQAAKLSSDIEEFYQSISYRVGRAVTLVPRVCVGALKRVRGGKA